MDIKDFFDSIHYGRVRGFFMKNKDFLFPNDIASMVAHLVCYHGHLPQGAPSSPVITNLITRILDFRILKITNKYKVTYTRYADDLTFSTNDKHFLEDSNKFINSISDELNKSGFTVNTSKTRLRFHGSRQEVTGLVVNQKVNTPREFYKLTRAMAYSLYKNNEFFIDDKVSSVRQLEGRFSFINQISQKNNKIHNNPSHIKTTREEEYRKFLIYKYFFGNDLPTIITEGKTDSHYLKAALKNLYKEYPTLIEKVSDNKFNFKIHFFNRTPRIDYFLGIRIDGGDSMKNIVDYYQYSYESIHLEHKKGEKIPRKTRHTQHSKHKQGENTPKYVQYFKDLSKRDPLNPVILIFDNEINTKNKKPLRSFINKLSFTKSDRDKLKISCKCHIIDNLYLVTTPLNSTSQNPALRNIESEIEDLFDPETLHHEINGKDFSRKDNDPANFYGKEAFSKYIIQNYEKIDFSKFRPLLNNIVETINDYSK